MAACEEANENFEYSLPLADYYLADSPLEPGERGAQLARLRYFVFNQINLRSKLKLYVIICYKNRPVKSVSAVRIEIPPFCARGIGAVRARFSAIKGCRLFKVAAAERRIGNFTY